ncbi:ArsR/SmtB family transcription factor [Desulfobacula toluolica]|uniref:Transcriptional regulator, ArsR family n=1 Tax=Desulfobacula toluolica (strain DSM 7467 / Tol2) TaxID=651182 RepID=K0N8P5_DESTT|nr:metalloregulator ArsR/SmtB family transcription factor [Desulfobacula toluolica]CCK80284.1 transcriptional regulator, ArsR family [Desulfobacula toluolica Tol2]
MELIKCFKALSDKTRVRLLYVLQKYELNVNEIVLVVDMIQSGVSRHLKILMESGLLTSRRDGSFIYYSAAKNENIKTFIKLIDQSLEKEKLTGQDVKKAREMIKIRQNKTKRFFKTVAPQWDQLKKEVLGNFDLNSMIMKKISFHGNISDLGCGTGELIESLSVEVSHNLIGIDSSPEMLELARLRLSGTDNAELRLGEIEHLPMKNKEIDTAIMNMVLHHISQPEISIAEVYRVLKPGGIFILSDFEKHNQEKIKDIMGGSWLGFEKEKIKTWLTDTGFHLKTIESYPVNHGLTINVFTAKKQTFKEKR